MDTTTGQMRRLIDICEAAGMGHNGPPELTLVKRGKALLGRHVADEYEVRMGDRSIGTAYGHYKRPKPGIPGGHTFEMTFRGKDFSGSRTRLLAWVEKTMQGDV